MKKIYTVLITFLLINKINAQAPYDPANVLTPNGVTVDAFKFTGTDMSTPEKVGWDNYYKSIYGGIEIIGEANPGYQGTSTYTYNCHSYAWYLSEQKISPCLPLPTRWIDDIDANYSPIYNVFKYYSDIYSGNNSAYIQTYNYGANLKVSYFPRDHSAVTTSDPNYFISKWARGPLAKHRYDNCPFYNNAQLKYYKLKTIITGSSEPLCSGSQRTFQHNEFNFCPSVDYVWSTSNNLSIVNSNFENVVVEKNTTGVNGLGWIQLEATSPSGGKSVTIKYFWVGPPIINSVIGPYSLSTNHWYTFHVDPNDSRANASYTWNLYPSNGAYFYPYNNYADVSFSQPGGYAIVVNGYNNCGTSNYGVMGFSVQSGGYYSMSPNPASESLTINIEKTDDVVQIESELPDYVKQSLIINKSDKTENSLIAGNNYIVRFFNNFGTLISASSHTGNSFTIPIHNLPNGSYIIEVSDGKNSYRKPLIVKHN